MAPEDVPAHCIELARGDARGDGGHHLLARLGHHPARPHESVQIFLAVDRHAGHGTARGIEATLDPDQRPAATPVGQNLGQAAHLVGLAGEEQHRVEQLELEHERRPPGPRHHVDPGVRRRARETLGRRHGLAAEPELAAGRRRGRETWLSMRSSSGPAPRRIIGSLVMAWLNSPPRKISAELALVVDRRLVGLDHGHAPRGRPDRRCGPAPRRARAVRSAPCGGRRRRSTA